MSYVVRTVVCLALIAIVILGLAKWLQEPGWENHPSSALPFGRPVQLQTEPTAVQADVPPHPIMALIRERAVLPGGTLVILGKYDDGSPAAGQALFISAESNGYLTRDGLTALDEHGKCVLSELMEGTYRVYASSSADTGFASVKVISGQESTLSIAIVSMGAVRGRVVDDNGQAVRDARVSVVSGKDHEKTELFFATSDADGWFSFKCVELPCQLFATADGMLESQQECLIGSGALRRAITLVCCRGGGALSVALRGLAASQMVCVYVTVVRRMANGGAVQVRRMCTNSDGTATRISGLWPGDYCVRVHGSGLVGSESDRVAVVRGGYDVAGD